MSEDYLEDRLIYEIEDFGRAEILMEIPSLFDVLNYLEVEIGLSSFYRYNEGGMDKVGRIHPNISSAYLKNIRGIVLLDDMNPPEHEDMYYLPNIYINLGTLIMEVPREARLNGKYDIDFWEDIVEYIKTKQQEIELQKYREEIINILKMYFGNEDARKKEIKIENHEVYNIIRGKRTRGKSVVQDLKQ